jgi:hypothetical protein
MKMYLKKLYYVLHQYCRMQTGFISSYKYSVNLITPSVATQSRDNIYKIDTCIFI